ncbi:MAG: phosphorylating glyceraldehyde-3-phosphate dehydrogenase [Candidatus Diapherotrites archaeon]|nr:phosphorylating glyceraldehyde-3-phosphate dehydrogenase [Candidatus Diapherotrites archaeon]
MIKVGVNGYGVIGKRVAYAITKQDDMELVGIAKTKPDFNAMTAIEKNHDVYCSIPENIGLFERRGMEIRGTINDLIEKCDVIVDATPGKIGAKNKPLYEKAGIKAIFEGGEKADTVQCSFNALCNYEEAIGKDYVRVVSCNTTGLARTIRPMLDIADIGRIRAVLVRRAADPVQSKKGPINAIVPVTKVPSHHGPDLKTVLPNIDIVSMAVAVPTTIMHLHTIMVELKDNISKDEIIEAWGKTPRVKLISSEDGFISTAEIMEYARALGRYMGDLYEIPVWEDATNIKDNELYYIQAVHQESDVVPENIDAIRAITGIEKNARKSIEKTNKSLGIR